MNYDEAIAFWYGRIDYERRQPKPDDLKLDRMRALLARLGNPHLRLRCIHIAGTKGKGSTSAMLASVLRTAGYRTGLFTSPHLSDIAERVQVDGVPISHSEIAARMSEVARAVEAMEAHDPTQTPTFFEVITALGFLHFDCRRVDIVVLEVGLGGRFDSTNVCEPVLSIITNISYDHMSILGNTLQAIAFEKAGIIKRNVPTITTANHQGAVRVIEQVARANDAPFRCVGRDFSYLYAPNHPFEPPLVRMATASRDWGWLPLGLVGEHQALNAVGVVAAVEVLRSCGLTLPDRAVRAGLANVVWPARMELFALTPVVVLDCAHNVASIKALLDTLVLSFPTTGTKHLLFAASSDKQIPEMLALLAPAFDVFHLTRYTSNPRSADPEMMAQLLGKKRVIIHANPDAAWSSIFAQLGPKDGVVIAGSVFLAGELRPLLVREFRS